MNRGLFRSKGEYRSLPKGVYLDKCGKFIAMIRHNRVLRYLGMFVTPEDASQAYDTAATLMFKEFKRR